LLACLLSTLEAGCAPEGGAAAPPAAPPIQAPSVGGLYIGQEIWLTYESAAHAQLGRRVLRPAAEAKAMAQRLRDRVLAGEDIGGLAREESNAPGGSADGFVLLPVNPAQPDERDLALMRVREGEVTALVDWRGGWWFAKRVNAAKGVELKQLFETLRGTEARGQAIVLHHKDAYPFKYDQKRTRGEAEDLARSVLTRALAGEDFATLARAYSSDVSGDNGGHLETLDAATKQKTPWIRIDNADFPLALLDALFRGEVAKVYPELLDTSRGFVIVKPLARRGLPR